MKSLNNYINEILTCSHSEHISEWRANTNTISSIKTQYFIYINELHYANIKIFEQDWTQFQDYKDRVYINGKHIEIDDDGWTKDYFNQGELKIEIKGIDEITNCNYMFYECTRLVEVPLFDTSKVKEMYKMFCGCENLRKVPLFDTRNVTTMNSMFQNCNNLETVPKFNIDNVDDLNFIFYQCPDLNRITIKNWSSVYDFEINKQKI